MDKDFHREFIKCPCCGSEERFLEELGSELKARGLAREEWSFHMDVREGVVLDPTKADAIPIGSDVPAFGFKTDICMDCGCVYAIDIKRADIKKSISRATALPPNRAERRREARGGDLFNPFSNS